MKQAKCILLLSILTISLLPLMAMTGQASASFTTDASRVEGAESSRVLGPFYEELGLEGDTPSPTSDSYMLWDDWGGTWYDAEKRPPDDDEGNPVDSPDEPPLDPDEEDDLMCWAATASNVLEWTGWGKVSGMTNTDQMFQHFQDHWYDDGGWMEWAWHWWFDGTSPPPDGSYVDVPGGGNFWSTHTFTDYYDEETTDSQTLQAIDNFLHSGYGVGLGIFDGGDGGHAITCWGFNYNSSVDKTTHPEDYYLGIWVTDSDDSKGSAPPAPNLLQYYEVEYDGTNNWWYMPNYGGGDWHISAVQALRARQYHSYAEIESGLRALESSGIAKVESIGVSVEGRQIWAVKISDDPSVDDENEPDILFVGLHHAREWISAEVPYYLAVNLVQTYQSDESIKTLIDNSEIWIVPVLNPDGLEYSQHVDRMWRKNRRDNGDGTFGVDLNRNYGYMWGLDSGSSGVTSAPTYRGPHAFSEPETIAIRDLISDPNRDFQAALSYHSYSQLILYPWGYTDESAPDSSVMSALAAEMSDLILGVHGETYTPQQSSQLYLTSGDLTDWVYGTTEVPAFTVELRPESSNPGFELPESEILDTCEENWPAALYLIRWVVLSQGGFMDFEDGVDEAAIRSTIPGMTFTTTMGYDWVYGDIRTGQYNVNPYGSRYYECHGNFFAWLGPNQGMGRIDFVGATARSVSTLTSTHYGTHLEAYDSSDSLIDSDYAGPNTRTGTMSEIAVTASSIAYVIVHDTGNYWLIDDLRVSDLLRETAAFMPPSATDVFQKLDTIDIGSSMEYDFVITERQVLKILLNWRGSELGIRVVRPDGTLFGEWESENPPIRIVVPGAEHGTWTMVVTALDVPYDSYPFAVYIASLPIVHDVDISIQPQVLAVKPGQIAEYLINVTNTGNAVDTYDLTLTFTDFNGLYRAYPTAIQPSWTTLNPASLTLNPEESANATLTITVPPEWAGLEHSTYNFTVTATCQADPTVTANTTATLIVEPTKRSRAEYVKLEIQWLKDDVADSSVDPRFKWLADVYLDIALDEMDKAIEDIVVTDTIPANCHLSRAMTYVRRFSMLIDSYRRRLPPLLAEEWKQQAQQIVEDITTAINAPT